MDSSDTGASRLNSIVPHFTVPDVVQTADYYRDVLGFRIEGYWDGQQVHHDPKGPAVFGIVQRDQARLHFDRADDVGARLLSGPALRGTPLRALRLRAQPRALRFAPGINWPVT